MAVCDGKCLCVLHSNCAPLKTWTVVIWRAVTPPRCISLQATTAWLWWNTCCIMGPMCTLKIKGTIIFIWILISVTIIAVLALSNCRWLSLFLLISGLVPLHNACSYGHYEVAELLVRHGASVNVADLWKFTPLHEAAAKGKYEICKLLLKVWFIRWRNHAHVGLIMNIVIVWEFHIILMMFSG